jgi:hypothetical protein
LYGYFRVGVSVAGLDLYISRKGQSITFYLIFLFLFSANLKGTTEAEFVLGNGWVEGNGILRVLSSGESRSRTELLRQEFLQVKRNRERPWA